MASETTIDTIHINIFGTGCTVVAGFIESSVSEKLNEYMKANQLSLEEVLSDYRNLHWLEIDMVRKWQDFGTSHFVSGLCESAYSFVELKINNKKTKLKLSDIYYQRSLFPIYNKRLRNINLTENTSDKNMLIAAETVIGKIGTTQFTTSNFDIEKLVFGFTTVKLNEKISYIILTEMNYDSIKLLLKKPDVLVNGFYVLLN